MIVTESTLTSLKLFVESLKRSLDQLESQFQTSTKKCLFDEDKSKDGVKTEDVESKETKWFIDALNRIADEARGYAFQLAKESVEESVKEPVVEAKPAAKKLELNDEKLAKSSAESSDTQLTVAPEEKTAALKIGPSEANVAFSDDKEKNHSYGTRRLKGKTKALLSLKKTAKPKNNAIEKRKDVSGKKVPDQTDKPSVDSENSKEAAEPSASEEPEGDEKDKNTESPSLKNDNDGEPLDAAAADDFLDLSWMRDIPTKPDKVECLLCNKIFTRKYCTNTHMILKHSQSGGVKCPVEGEFCWYSLGGFDDNSYHRFLTILNIFNDHIKI